MNNPNYGPQQQQGGPVQTQQHMQHPQQLLPTGFPAQPQLMQPNNPANLQQFQDLQQKMMMQNYARQQQQQLRPNSSTTTSPSSGPASQGGSNFSQSTHSSPIHPNPQHAHSSPAVGLGLPGGPSSHHGTPAPPLNNSRPPSAAGGAGPMVNGAIGVPSRTTSASPFVQPRHPSQGPPQTGPSPSPINQSTPHGMVPPPVDVYGTNMGVGPNPGGFPPGVNINMNAVGPGGLTLQQQQQQMAMLSRQQPMGSMMMGNGNIPGVPMQMPNGTAQPRHPSQGPPGGHPQASQQLQQQQQQHQQPQARRPPSMPPPGSVGSSIHGSPMVRSTSTVPNQQQQMQAQQQNAIHLAQQPHNPSVNGVPASDHFPPSQQLGQPPMMNGNPQRGSVPDMAFLAQQQQLRAAAAALANAGQQPPPGAGITGMSPIQMQQMMNGRMGGMNGMPQPGAMGSMDPAAALALQSLGSGLDHPPGHPGAPGHGAHGSPHPPPHTPHRQTSAGPPMGMSPAASKMMPPPQTPHAGGNHGAPSSTPRMGHSSVPLHPSQQHHTPQHGGPQHHGMMPPPTPTRSMSMNTNAPNAHGFPPHGAPGRHDTALPLGPHPTAPSALPQPPPPGGLLSQLDQVRHITRQAETQMRQEHAHLFGGTGPGGPPSRDFGVVMRDVYGITNPKYPPPASGIEQLKAQTTSADGSAKPEEGTEKPASAAADEKPKVKTEDDTEDVPLDEKDIPSRGTLSRLLEQISPPFKDLDPSRTRISVLPRAASPSDTTHGGALPPLSPNSLKFIKEMVMPRDDQYEAEWREMQERMEKEARLETGGTLKWWERDTSVPVGHEERERMRRSKLEVVWPGDGRAQREARKKHPELRLPRLTRAQARTAEELVPIRIDIEQEGHRLRETFVWNINDTTVTPEMFAQLTCDDLELPKSFKSQFSQQVRTQIADYQNHQKEYSNIGEGCLPKGSQRPSSTARRGALDDEDQSWWARWRKRIRVDEDGAFVGVGATAEESDAKSMPPPSSLPRANSKGAASSKPSSSSRPAIGSSLKNVQIVVDDDDEHSHEMRVIIKLDITAGSVQLVDQFEWDITDRNASPERFAEIYAADVGLSGEFTTAIAHDIREQVLMLRKALSTTGHSFDPIEPIDEELRDLFLPVVTSVTRNVEQAEWYMPKIHYLNDLDLEKMERDREKEIRRKKRLGRARFKVGVAEKEPQKTQRTMPGATEINFGLPPAAIVNVAPSRRAAAQQASATIANLAAAENSERQYPGYYPPAEAAPVSRHQPMNAAPSSAPAPLPVPAPKKKNILLHAPTLNDDIYSARAKLELSHPTESTSLRPQSDKVVLSRARGEGEGPSLSRPVFGTPAKSHSGRAPTAKEINDAKIKEYAEGLHPVMVNGKWHCSVCGCPDEIAIGRRKGPLGEKTMCGDCGKFYHRHRRPNDQVEYNTDPEFHLAKKKGSDEARRLRAKRGGGTSRLAAEPASAADTPTSAIPAETPASDDDDDDDDDVPLAARAGRPSQPPPSSNRILSDLSDPDSGAEENGNLIVKIESKRRVPRSASNSSLSPPPPLSTPLPNEKPLPAATTPNQGSPLAKTPVLAETPAPPQTNGVRPALARKPTGPHVLVPAGTPDWLKEQLESTSASWPQDDFGAVQRPPATPGGPPEWRIKCYDCPGMLYKPGPGHTLDNFIVHLRNRNHRNNVSKRIMEAESVSADVTAADGA